MTYRSVDLLKVSVWGRLVGAIAPDPGSRTYVFEYAPAFRRHGIDLAPTTMPLGGRQRMFRFPRLPRETYFGLPPMIADSLPDTFGNSIIDAYMAAQGIPAEQVTPLDRLAYLSDRAMGALTFEPDLSPDTAPPSAIDMVALVGTARAAVQGNLSTEASAEESLKQILAVGTSAGGARAKAVLAIDPDTGDILPGNVPVPAGHEQWLLKFDGVGPDADLGIAQQYGRTEYAYYLMARAAGITMAESRLLHENGRAHFMSRRFDREGSSRIHMQSLCALGMLDYNAIAAHDYAQYFQVADQLALGENSRAEIFRRMVFNVLASNCDDHTKNSSFLLPEEGSWQLAPAYDVTYAYSPGSNWTHQHLMGVDGRFDHITSADTAVLADRHQVPAVRDIIARVQNAVASWSEFANQADLDPATRDLIAHRLDETRLDFG